MISLFTRQVPPCQPYFRVVDKDWAGGLVTAHAAYPRASPAPSSPPVAWGEPEAYAKVTSRAQHLESIADADPLGAGVVLFGDARAPGPRFGQRFGATRCPDNPVPPHHYASACRKAAWSKGC